MDPRLLTPQSREQFAKASNAASRYQRSALRTGEADIKNNPFMTTPFSSLFQQQLREGRDIGSQLGAALSLDPTIASYLFRKGNLGVDDIATLQGIPDLYG
jgi:hypothetical protein